MQRPWLAASCCSKRRRCEGLAMVRSCTTQPSAARPRVEEIRAMIGATSLAYLSHDGLVAATQRPESELCRACLTRDYPTRVPVEQAKLRFEGVSA